LFSSCRSVGGKLLEISSSQSQPEPGGRISVHWPWNDEAWVFSSEEGGRHMETRSLFTDSPLVSFGYDDIGRLNKIVNKRRSLITIE
jgi:hypothetical protein